MRMFTHVRLIALALDVETDTTIRNQFLQNQTVTVQNLESFYNYRTKGETFELVTSVLSCHDIASNCKL